MNGAPPRPFLGRVLFVHHSADLYGSDRVLLQCALAVNAAGGEAIVALPCAGPLALMLAARGVKIHLFSTGELLRVERKTLSPSGIARLLMSLPAAWRGLDRCLTAGRIDLVCSNTLAVLGGAIWARQRGIAHLWHVHEMVERPALAAPAYAWLLSRLADIVICNSAATRDFYVRRRPQLAQTARVVWNGVDDPFGSSHPHDGTADRALCARFRPRGVSLAVGLLGRFNRMKGHAVLLEATERLAAEGRTDFSLVFIGSPPPGQEEQGRSLRARIDSSSVGDRVGVFDFMTDPAPAYAALDIVCVPSCEAEAFGLVAVEAMASRRPVLAARIGGLPEVVEDEVTGLLHVAGDAVDLARQLARLLDDRDLRFKLASAGRARFEAAFSMQSMTAKVLDAYTAVVRSRGGQARRGSFVS